MQDEFEITIPTDNDGFVLLRCPRCGEYFKLLPSEYNDDKVNELLKENKNVTYSESLHLGVSLRSFRAEKLSAFAYALLAVEPDKASELYKEIKEKYPIVLTRDMGKAKA